MKSSPVTSQSVRSQPATPAPVGVSTRLLLAGGGHAHAIALRAWATRRPPGAAITLVAPSRWAPYSGMVPGWLAGTYRYSQIHLDLAALCAQAGARFVLGTVAGIDAAAGTLQLVDGQVLTSDRLSLNLGSTLQPPTAAAAGRPALGVLALRPLADLHRGWAATLAAVAAWPAGQPLRVTAVGGGAAGAEALLAVRARIVTLRPDVPVHARLVSRSARLLPGLAAGAARRLQGVLVAAGVEVQLGTDWLRSRAGSASASAATSAPCDLLLWATGAEAPVVLRGSGLALDGAGFVRIDAQLRSVSHPTVSAVGDCAAWATPLPKSGVHAVRMAPLLAANLHAACAGDEPQAWQPQRHTLALLATADGQAIGAWGPFAARGAWLWRWKDHIDRAFIAGFDRGEDADGWDADLLASQSERTS